MSKVYEGGRLKNKGMKEKEEGGGFAWRSRERGAIEFLLDCLAKEVHFKIIKF